MLMTIHMSFSTSSHHIKSSNNESKELTKAEWFCLVKRLSAFAQRETQHIQLYLSGGCEPDAKRQLISIESGRNKNERKKMQMAGKTITLN